MKKFFQSKGFIVTSLTVLCVAILGVCWFASRDCLYARPVLQS